MHKKLKIAVIGCGTAGLAAAIGLAADHDVHLFEKFDTPKPVGAGILLQCTGLKALRCLGLEEAILSKGAVIYNLDGRDCSGSQVFNVNYADLSSDLSGLGIHRGTLFETLFNAVQKPGIKILTATAIQDSFQKSGLRFLIDQHQTEIGPYDLVIDASGGNSTLRQKHAEMLYNKPFPYGALWFVFEDANRNLADQALIQVYDNAHKMLGLLPVGERPDDHKNCTTVFWSLPVEAYKNWQDTGLDVWKEELIRYYPPMESALQQIHSHYQLAFARYSHSMMKRWNYDQLVFIGDAGHTMSPQLGQGANLALVDAVVLTQAIRQHPSVSLALETYTQLRKDHLRFYQLASRLLTPFFQSNYKSAGFIRNMSFDAMYKIPYIRKEMIRTLIGAKTGLFKSLSLDSFLNL